MTVSVAETDETLRVVYRPLRDLVPYTRNARTHTADQVNKIKASLVAFGWTNPMLIAGNDMIAGHARLRAAIALAEQGTAIKRNADPWSGPTIDLSHLDDNERRAYIIADNRLAEDAGWDRDLLQIDMSELRVSGFDLSLTGFAGLEIDVLLGGGTRRDTDDDSDRDLSDPEQAVWDDAWCRLMDEWHGLFEAARTRDAYLSTTFTKGALAVSFTRALLFGGEIQRGATLAYQPSRLWVNANNLPISDVFLAAKQNPSLLESVRWQCGGRPTYDKFIAATLGIHGHRAPGDFPAHLARNLIDEFCPVLGGRVLDPCHGWGGRMLGFLLARYATHYHGFDVSPQAQHGVRAMFDDLRSLCHDRDKSAQLDLIPFQDATLAPDSYDFALTSPPYFDVEKYDGEQQSWRQFATFDEWVAGFYRPLIANTAAALKPGGTFALQVGSQMFPLTRLAKEIAARVGLDVIAIRQTDMTNAQQDTAVHEGEVVVILRKPDGSPLPAGIVRYVAPNRPIGYLDQLDGVTVRRITTLDEAKGAIRVRQPWAGKMLRPLPPVVYYGAMEEGRLFGAFNATNAVIGYAMVRRRKRANTVDLQQLAVHDDAPKGVGRRLITMAWDYAVDRGAVALTVNTLLTSIRAREVYEKYGFSETSRDEKDINFSIVLAASPAAT
jgi:ParB-like chromosome segregation protein Spo0J/ribosomal protein S18 acetylase RimI-like enzyme